VHGILDAVRVHVPARSRVALVQDHVVIAIERPGRREARNAAPHDRNLHAASLRVSWNPVITTSSRRGSDRIIDGANRQGTANE
jgi:hypothetical protein